jgi:hypothetical protein
MDGRIGGQTRSPLRSLPLAHCENNP